MTAQDNRAIDALAVHRHLRQTSTASIAETPSPQAQDRRCRHRAIMLPHGLVTFLTTDIEGWTPLGVSLGDERRKPLKARFLSIARDCVESNHGAIFKDTGDGFLSAFDLPTDAILAAVGLQRELVRHPFAEISRPLSVRAALHIGEAEPTGNDYSAVALDACNKLMSLAHGGQILASEVVAAHAPAVSGTGIGVRSLGKYQIGGFPSPERVYQMTAPDLCPEHPPLRAVEFGRLGLPRKTGGFFGRTVELAAIADLIQRGPSLLLHGSPWVGKSRLAIEAARDLRTRFDRTVLYADCEEHADPTSMWNAIGRVLGAPLSGTSEFAAVIDRLRGQSVFLVLDNCDRFETDISAFLRRLIEDEHCAGTKLIVTNRSQLGVQGLMLLPVGPLDIGRHPERLPFNHFAALPSVRLFADQAAVSAPEFQLLKSHQPAIARILTAVDGLPELIRLAAAQLASMPLEQVSKRASDASLLDADAGAKLGSFLEGHWAGMSHEQRECCAALSVFISGWTMNSAIAVCAGHPEHRDSADSLDHTGVGRDAARNVPAALSTLVKRAFVEYDRIRGRYRFMSPYQRFVEQKLRDLGPASVARAIEAHRSYFLRFAAAVPASMDGTEQASIVQLLDDEHQNCLSVVEGLLALPDPERRALSMATDLHWYWYMRGRGDDGHDLMERAVAASPDAPELLRGRALNALGTLRRERGDLPGARQSFLESLKIWRRRQDRRREAALLDNLAIVAQDAGRLDEALAAYRQSIGIRDDLNDTPGVHRTQLNLSGVFIRLEELDNAEQLLQPLPEFFRSAGDRHREGVAHYKLAQVAWRRADARGAFQRLHALMRCAIASDDPRAAVLTAGFAAEIAAGSSHRDEAAAFLSSARAWAARAHLRVGADEAASQQRAQQVLGVADEAVSTLTNEKPLAYDQAAQMLLRLSGQSTSSS